MLLPQTPFTTYNIFIWLLSIVCHTSLRTITSTSNVVHLFTYVLALAFRWDHTPSICYTHLLGSNCIWFLSTPSHPRPETDDPNVKFQHSKGTGSTVSIFSFFSFPY